MILVDSSVWIDFLTGASSLPGSALKTLVAEGGDICIADVNLMEVLRGVKKDSDYRKVKNDLLSLPVLSPSGRESFVKAAEIYRTARQSGVTINSTFDCLIAVVAMENDASILHRDADFDRLAKIVKGLKIISPETILI